MSQHKLDPKNPNHEILIGWDPMLNTLFLHVWDNSKNEDDDGRDILWLPLPGERILYVTPLVEHIKEYADISDNALKVLVGKLTRDMD